MCDNRVNVIDQAVGKLQQIVQGQQALIDELTAELAKQRKKVDALSIRVVTMDSDVMSQFPEGLFPPVV